MKNRRSFRGAFRAAAVFSVAASLLPVGTGRAGDLPPSPRRAVPPDAALAGRMSHLTLDDAIDIALHRNPQILQQLQEIQRLQGVFIEVRAAALPHVVAAGTFEQQDRRLVQSGGGGTSGVLAGAGTSTGTVVTGGGTGTGTGTVAGNNLNNLNFVIQNSQTGQQSLLPFNALFGGENVSVNDKSYTVTVEVQQTIYNAAIPPQIRQARFLRDAAYYALRESVDTTINTVKTNFYTVLFDQANIANQQENLRLLQSQLTDQQNRFAAGTVPRFDVLQASVAVANQRPNVIQAQNTISTGFIGLARSLGIEYGPLQEKNSPIKLVGNLDYRPQNFDPEAGVAAGKANRALLKQQRLNILSQVEQIRIAAAGYQPTLTADGGFEARNRATGDDLGQAITGWFYGANFNWNIFDGLATYGRVKQANALLRESRLTYIDDVNSVVQDIQTNFLTLQQDKELIASQVLNVSEAEEAVRLAQARLSAGAGTQLDVLTSQEQLLAAQTTELQARYQYAVTLSNYERVTGTSTVYDEAFDDPLTNRRYPSGVDTTGTTEPSKKLPLGTVKTPDVKARGSGKPLDPKINASANDRQFGNDAPIEKPKQDDRSRKPLNQREHLLEDR